MWWILLNGNVINLTNISMNRFFFCSALHQIGDEAHVQNTWQRKSFNHFISWPHYWLFLMLFYSSLALFLCEASFDFPFSICWWYTINVLTVTWVKKHAFLALTSANLIYKTDKGAVFCDILLTWSTSIVYLLYYVWLNKTKSFCLSILWFCLLFAGNWFLMHHLNCAT